jgi:hypothetical protein
VIGNSLKQAGTLKVSKNPHILATHMLETASSLNWLLLSPSQQDTYPDLEFHSPFMTSSQAEVSHRHGLVGQDMRHLA